MELDERKLKILKAIVRNYLETGEPVGSRTISKYTDLNLSSATIRNEMSDLEDMGYILQPHTSAGRIPSDKGYRTYVDDMMREKADEISQQQQEISDMKDFLTEKVEKVEELLQNTAKLLANNTNYATMISAPRFAKRIKFLQLSLVDDMSLLCVVVLDGNIIKNKLVKLSKQIDAETVLKLNILFNSTLNGLTMEEINLGIITKITGQAGEHMELVKRVLEIIAEVVGSDEDMKIYTSGTTNILKYPELSDNNRASELINVLEEKQQLISLITENNSEENTGIQVYIGDETPVQNMKDCSVVTMTYEIEDGVQGTIGIIGPKRMDYEKVVESLKTVKGQLDVVFKNNNE
ncbi:heat-inducible transcriptional repressor HrcA [Lachnospiraceae bacterium HCP1S3_C3]|nr:heat-inducible transcriptional repressor HrcA [Lachnospiraceae bacterium]MDD6857559.1 heat-inducible transcriptional repressor HrcA [Lachnospiraceae bacterium]